MAVEMGIIKKSGAWFSYGETRLGQGRDNVKDYIEKTPEFAKEIEDLIKAKKNEVAEAEQKSPKTADKKEPVTKSITKEKARAAIDILVEDDE